MLVKAAARKRERNPAETRQRIVGATMQLILKQGFAASSVEQICAQAGVTKGSFFHHFESKEAVGKAAIEAWGEFGTALYAEAWKSAGLDPLEQLHGMFDIMAGFTRRPEVCTCVVGMLSQEAAQSNEVLRQAAARELERWTENVVMMLAAAKKKHAPKAKFDPAELAWFLNSLWQGSMLIGKTCKTPEMIRRNLKIARDFVDGLLQPAR